MSHADALDALADDPRLWRYRRLCDDANPDVEQRDGYRALVVRLARGEPPPSTPAVVGVSYGDPSPGPCRGCPGSIPPPTEATS